MAWFKADDRIMEHEKFIAARANGGHAAIGVWFHAGTWCNSQLTDGFVPRSWTVLNRCETEAQVLVEAGLWVEDASRDGFQFHDFSDYQPLKADVESKRKADLERKARGGSKRNPRGIQAEDGSPVARSPEPVSTPNGVERARKRPMTAKGQRNRQRLGLVADQGGTQ
jgi:hypothetical protein